MLSLLISYLANINPWKIIPAAILIFLAAAVVGNEVYRRSLRVRHFNGPLGAPVVGNLWQIRNKDAAQQYQVWSRKYGAVFQIQLGNKPILVINTADAAKQILGGKLTATSSRPEFYTFHKVVSKGSVTTIGTSPQNASLKRRRKVMATALNKPAVERHTGFIDAETKQLIKEANEIGMGGKKSIDPIPLFLRLSMSLGFTLHWGTRVADQDSLFREITDVEMRISNSRSTTSNYQDYVPLLRILPGSKTSQSHSLQTRRNAYLAKLDRDLDQRIKEKTYSHCVRADVMLDPEGKLTMEELTSLNVTMTAAGLDTMQSTITWCIAVLAMRQDIQEKALAAIRQKYSENEPLCDAHDQQSIDYVMALIKETTRCYPATRLSLPRETTDDIMFEDKCIPRGTILFLNAWACNRDTDLWPDADIFRPERWLEHPDAPNFAFGVGSRMCIGIHLTHRELYVVLTRLINSFHITSPDAIELDSVAGVAETSATVAQPRPYKVTFTARNPEDLSESLRE